MSLVLGDFLRGHPHGSALMEVKLYVFVTFLSCSHSNSSDGYKNLVNEIKHDQDLKYNDLQPGRICREKVKKRSEIGH